MANEESLREDGVSNLGYSDIDESEEADLQNTSKEEAVSELPREENEGKKCIDPCPRFECKLDTSTCDGNCGRCLANPCLICEHSCQGKTVSVLLREEYKKYKRFYGGREVDAVYKDKAAERRADLFDKKEELEDKLETIKESARESALPSKLAYLLQKKQIKNIEDEMQEVENRMDEQVELFEYE